MLLKTEVAKRLLQTNKGVEFANEWESFANSLECRMWVALARQGAAYTWQLRTLFGTVFTLLRGAAWDAGIVFVKPEKPGRLRYYVNGTFRYGVRIGRPEFITAYDFTGLSAFRDKVKADKATERLAVNFKSRDRIRSYVRKTREVTVQRFIQELLPHVSEDIAKRTADRIVAELVPPTIHYAETPEDFMKMYALGGVDSCMAVKEGRNNAIHTLGLVGPSWFAYYPDTKGAYICVDGRVTARTILYRQPLGEWYHGRIFGDHEGMLKALRTAGITQYMRDREVQVNRDFTVPGFFSESLKTYISPVPYFDNLDTGQMAFTYDETTHTFHWHVGTEAHNKTRNEGYTRYSSLTDGYLTASSAKASFRCAYCGTRHESRGYRLPDTDHRVCSTVCMESMTHGEWTLAMSRAGELIAARSAEVARTIEGDAYVSRLCMTERAYVYQPRGAYSYPEEQDVQYTSYAPPPPSASSVPEEVVGIAWNQKVQRNMSYYPGLIPSLSVDVPRHSTPFGDIKALRTYGMDARIFGTVSMPRPRNLSFSSAT